MIPSSSKANILIELQKIYNISEESLFQNSGIIVNYYKEKFEKLKRNIYILTLWSTGSEKLDKDSYEIALKMTEGRGENAFKDCINLSTFVLGRTPK